MRKISPVILTSLAGVLLWVIDAWLDSSFIYSGTFLELLILNPPLHEILIRGALILLLIGSGWVMTRSRQRSSRTRDQQQILIDHFPNGAVLLYDQDLRYTFAEGKALQEAGLNKTEMVGKKIQEVFPDDVIEIIQPAYQAALQGEETALNVSFQDRTYRMHAVPVTNADQSINQGMILTQDITAEIQQQAALQHSEQRFRRFLDQVNFLGVILNKDGKILYCNDYLLQVTGYTRSDLIGKSWFEIFIPPEEKQQLREEIFLKAITNADVKTHHTNPILTSTGERLLVNWNNIVYRGPTGKVTGTASLGQDITQLEEYRRELESIFKMSLDLICIAELDTFRFIEVNPAFERVLGYPREELLQKPFLEFVHPEDRSRTIEIVEERLKRGDKVLSFTNRYICQDGSYRWLDWVSYPVPEEGFTYAIARDITQKRKQEQELDSYRQDLEELVEDRTRELQQRVDQVEQLNQGILNLSEDLQKTNTQLSNTAEQLVEANRDLEAFVYSVSHDLRAPLRGITGFAEILAERHREDLNQEGQRYMDYIVQAGNRMNDLIMDLLGYARLGKRAVRQVPVDCEAIYQDVLLDLNEKIHQTGGKIIPEKEFPQKFSSDQTLLKQILLNLLDNSLTYYQPDIPPQINLNCKIENDRLLLTVTDNGIGIPAEHHQKVFEIFQRLHSQEDYPGTGIGLALVKKAVDMLDGELELESTPGEGTSVQVRLPIQNQEVDHD